MDGARTRRRVLRDGAVGAAAACGLLGLSAAGRAAGAAASLPASDAKILNFLLELERLQASFFARAAGDKRFGTEVRQFAKVTASQDKAHVEALRRLLGPAAAGTTGQLRADPRTDADFVRDAAALKEAAVAAYIGEAPNLHVDRITKVAEIVSVEARHAAWIRSIQDTIPAPRAADRSQTPSAVVRTLQQGGIADVR
jgi:hypothetical protein